MTNALSRRFALPPALRRAIAAALVPGVLGAAACAGRAVEVTTGASTAPSMSLTFTNNLSQAVNVYVRASGSSEIFLRQVPAKSTERIAVRGVSTSAGVTLRAAPVDGSQGYTRDNVTLGGDASWSIP